MKRILSIILFFTSFHLFGQSIKNNQIEKAPVVRQGNPIGTIFEKTVMSDTTGMSHTGGSATYTIVADTLMIDAPGGVASRFEIDSVTSLDIFRADFLMSFDTLQSPGGSFYGFNIVLNGVADNNAYSIAGRMYGANDGNLGQLSIFTYSDFVSTTVASGVQVPSINVHDKLLFRLETFENTVTWSVKNVTDNSAWYTLTYTFTGTDVKHGFGKIAIQNGGGRYKVHSIKITSQQIENPDLYLFGDSKFTKSTFQNESLPVILKNYFGAVVANSGSGGVTANMVANKWEVVNFVKPKKILINASNDIRNGVSSGTWQANLLDLYTFFTEHGIQTYFIVLYETSASQAAMDSWLATTFPDNYIQSVYTNGATCTNCLLADNIHRTYTGNRETAYDLMLDGRLKKESPFKEYRFIADEGAFDPMEGDSIIVDVNFYNKKIDIYRNGILQWQDLDYDYQLDTITLHPPLDSAERIIVQVMDTTFWTNIVHVAPPVVEEFVDFVVAGDLTETSAGTWYSAAGTGKGYSTKTLAASDEGYFYINNNDGLNTNSNPIGLDDDANNTDDFDDFEFGVFAGGDNIYYYVDGGVGPTSSGVAAAAGDLVRLRKTGTTVYAEKSADSGATWTAVRTYATSANHTLYAKTHLVAATKKIVEAKIYNFH
jgi:hypothetical protein